MTSKRVNFFGSVVISYVIVFLLFQDGEPLSSLATGLTIKNGGRHLIIIQAQTHAGTTNLTTLLTVYKPPGWNTVCILFSEVTVRT